VPVEEVARYPRPGTAVPRSLAFSPDDTLVTFLFSEEGTLQRQLYSLDIESGKRSRLVDPPGGGVTEESLTLEERLRRERRRERGLGVTRYAWAEDTERILLPLRGALHVQDGRDGELRLVLDSAGKPALDPRITRDGSLIAYVQDAELYVVPAAGGKARQITRGARGTGKTNGLAEYVAQEEMGRHHGHFFSYDGKHIAYTEVDETHIPVYRIVHQGEDSVGEGAQEDHHYPFPGAPNAKVRLGVIPVTGGRTTWMDLGDAEYLARVHWMPDGGLIAELENREQTRLDLVRFDPRTGEGKTLLVETSEIWINLHHMFRPLEESEGELEGGFLWASERSGFRHLYLYAADGELIRQLTSGEWVVDSVAGIDEKKKTVYFVATKESPTERHLYSVPFDGGEPARITKEAGTHDVQLDHDCRRFIDTHSSIAKPPTITLRSLPDGKVVQTIHDAPDPRVASLDLPPPELVTLQARDGTTLHGALYRPSRSTAGPPPYPTIVSVYGGPHAQTVTNSWGMTVDMRAQYLRSLGYLVFKLDNRGSARRGLAFEGAVKHDLGNLEVQDQVDGVRWLVEQGLTDAARVGIYGWSYGGYMSAMALARAPETFKVAVAGAPVTSWDGYDSYYTERYMDTPASNPDGYEVASVMHHVEKMRGKLMLVHGLIDENVHFRHTARLIQELIAQRKDYELELFPNERHMPRKEKDRVYMEETIQGFFQANL